MHIQHDEVIISSDVLSRMTQFESDLDNVQDATLRILSASSSSTKCPALEISYTRLVEAPNRLVTETDNPDVQGLINAVSNNAQEQINQELLDCESGGGEGEDCTQCPEGPGSDCCSNLAHTINVTRSGKERYCWEAAHCREADGCEEIREICHDYTEALDRYNAQYDACCKG